jgi:hypothetical protein
MSPEVVGNSPSKIARLRKAIEPETRVECGLVGKRHRAVLMPDGDGQNVPMWTFKIPITRTVGINIVLFEDSQPGPGAHPYWRMGPILGKPLSERTDEVEIEEFYRKARIIRTSGRRVGEDELDWQLRTAALDARNGDAVLPHW